LQADTQQNLIQMLDNSHKDVRTSAVEAVGKQNITEAFEQLLHLLDHNSEPEKNVRRAAIRSLRQLADTPTQKELARPHLERVFLQDPDHLVVQDAAAVIVALYKDSAADLLLNALQKRQENETWRKGYAGIVRALGDCNMPEANQYLFEQLEKQMRADVVNIARLIALLRPAGLAGGSRSLPILFELVQRDDPAFSWIAVQVMADIGDPQIIEPLQQYLTYKRSINQCEPNLEAVILVTLVRMGMWDYLPDLVALLRDTSHEREVARRRALGVLPDLQVDLSSMLLLMAISPQHTPHEKIRETSVRSLSRLSGQIDRLIHALQWQAQSDPRAKIRDEAKSAIESITRRISYLHRRLQRQIPFDTEAHLCWNQQPIHPVWLNQWEERKSSFIPMSLCYTPPTDILEANVSDILDDIETVETTELAAEAEQTSPQFTSESSTTDATITPSTTTQTTAPTAFIPSATTDTDKPLSLTSPPVTPIIAELPTPSAQPLTSIPTTDLTSTAPPLKAKKKAPAETPSTATKIEITAPEKPKPPSFLEQMLFAIATDDYHKISKLAQSPEAETLKPLWSDLWEFLAEKHNLVAKLGRDWIVVPGDPWGEANNWPFLMMTRPVNVCEYELFCEQTDHPLPERWELLANKKKLTIPIANITWWDANIYAETNGWMLPSHNQLILASACRNTTLLGEEVDNRSVFAWQEWTSTIHQHRHQLIQIFSLDEQLISHLRRDAKAFDLVFRCVIPLDCRKNSFGLALLQSHQRNASNFFRFVAQQRRVELPKATEEWLNYLEHLNPSQISDTSHALWSAVPEIPEDTSSNTPISKSPITQSISIKPTLPKLHTTSQEQISSDSLTPESPPITLGTLSSTTISTEPKVSPITAPVQLSQLEEAMDLVRDLELEPQMSLNELEQYPQQDQHVQKKLRQQAKDHYWKLIESGAWSQACEWLDVESELLPTSLTQQREGLIELCDWLQRQSGMVWLEGKTYGQAEDIGEYVMLVQSGYVSRGEFYRFCLERQIPLPPQWKDSPQIQDSDEPATEVSALAAHAYADYAQAQLPSLEQLQRLSPCMFLDRTIGEWTCTHYSHNARLYYSLSPADTSGQQSQRTMRRDEPARYVGFRLYQNISYTELPALLQMLVQHLPPAFPIDRFSQLLGPALRVHLNFAAQ
jgi:HEAT repeat protein